jgi:hypothetical protein
VPGYVYRRALAEGRDAGLQQFVVAVHAPAVLWRTAAGAGGAARREDAGLGGVTESRSRSPRRGAGVDRSGGCAGMGTAGRADGYEEARRSGVVRRGRQRLSAARRGARRQQGPGRLSGSRFVAGTRREAAPRE